MFTKCIFCIFVIFSRITIIYTADNTNKNDVLEKISDINFTITSSLDPLLEEINQLVDEFMENTRELLDNKDTCLYLNILSPLYEKIDTEKHLANETGINIEKCVEVVLEKMDQLPKDTEKDIDSTLLQFTLKYYLEYAAIELKIASAKNKLTEYYEAVTECPEDDSECISTIGQDADLLDENISGLILDIHDYISEILDKISQNLSLFEELYDILFVEFATVEEEFISCCRNSTN